MTGITRIFLGWDGPALKRACGVLFDLVNAGRDGVDADLSNITVATPGGRAGRLLLGLMIDRAEELGLALSPPVFVTPGEIANVVLGNLGRAASPVQARLAWVRAIAACDEQEVAALLPHKPGDIRALSAAASLLEAAHDELIGDGIRFEEVQRRAGTMLRDSESARWRAASIVQGRYRDELSRIGFIDDGLARMEALASLHSASPKQIVLIGVSELSEIARRALRVEGIEVTTLIAAPEMVAATLDEFGCVKVGEWADRHVAIPDDSIVFAEGPEEQAHRAMEAIARLEGRFAPHEVVIAVPDEEVIPRLQRATERFGGVEARPAAGIPLASSAVLGLLRGIKTFREDGSFASLAALVRHPDMEKYLLGVMSLGPRERWLAMMDSYQQEAVPSRNDEGPLRIADAGEGRVLESVCAAVRRLLAPLDQPGPAPALEVMGRIFAGQRVGRDDRSMQETIRGCEAVRDALLECAALPTSWLPSTSEELLGFILDVLASKQVPVDSSPESIELLGWLELPLDPAPVAIITGLNDGTLPESFGPDPLLPDALREKLGLACSRGRLARDAFLLSVVAHSRSHLTLISARTGAEGDPLLPSRLLSLTDDDTVVHRIRRFVKDASEPRLPLKLTPGLVAGGRNEFPLLPLVSRPRVESMRVTAFRTFLASPYLFFLEQVMKLKQIAAGPPELDRMQFGVLVHDALYLWGTSDAKHSTDGRVVRSALRDHLGTLARERFGKSPAVAVAMQLEIAANRLDEFSRWQASWRQSGWRVEHAEWKPEGGRAKLDGLDFDFHIRGKIDRIDRHDDGRVAILDYKTGDSGDSPRKTHGCKDKWKDLQLPLYRHLAAGINLPENPERTLLGYVTLPRRPTADYFLVAEWSPEDFADADALAHKIATRVYNGEFNELGKSPPTEGAFGALCGTAFLDAFSADEEEGE